MTLVINGARHVRASGLSGLSSLVSGLVILQAVSYFCHSQGASLLISSMHLIVRLKVILWYWNALDY